MARVWGIFYCIDATKRGDITTTGRVWHYDKIRRSISTPAIQDGLVYYPDFSGFLHCVDAKTGQALWVHDMLAAMWGSPLWVDGKIYLGDEDGDIVVLQQLAAPQCLRPHPPGRFLPSTSSGDPHIAASMSCTQRA